MATIEGEWHYPAPVPESVVLGERAWLYSSFAFVHHQSKRRPSVRVGADSGLYLGAYFDLGPEGEVCIGDYCSIAGTVISTEGRVTLGDYVFIAHSTVLADRVDAVPPSSRGRIGPSSNARADINIGDNVWIGARAIVLGGSDIGADAVVGAGAVIDGMQVPTGAIVGGNPAVIIGAVA
jgi:acetyltransferase-like isoleucine patch superfamily enzyme